MVNVLLSLEMFGFYSLFINIYQKNSFCIWKMKIKLIKSPLHALNFHLEQSVSNSFA